jgi:hypothetical protein
MGPSSQYALNLAYCQVHGCPFVAFQGDMPTTVAELTSLKN